MYASCRPRPLLLACAAALIAAPAFAPRASADALVDNVQGVTLDKQGRVIRFKAMVVDKAGRVVRLIAPDEQPPKRTKKNPGPVYDWRADMKGRVLVPGMIDAHGHVIELGLQALTLDLSDTTSLEMAKAKIAAYAKGNPERQWIIGTGWNLALIHI